MGKTAWKDLTEEARNNLVERRYVNGEDVIDLANALGMSPLTLDRYLRGQRAFLESQYPGISPRRKADIPESPDRFYDMLKKGPWSLSELSRKFDRSEESILDAIENLEREGFMFDVISRDVVKTTNRSKPRVDTRGMESVLDDTEEIVFAIASDSHAGSTHAQPTNRANFIELAYHEFGVRHIFDPGDLTTGVNGYRGQEFDLVPAIRPSNRHGYAQTIIDEVWLADQYTPKLDDLTYYVLGGNHDYWGVSKASVDPIYRLAQMRDDTVYLGYDQADIPLTDNLIVRLWHPRGGGGFSLTTKLQRGVERLIRDEFKMAMETESIPRSHILVAGHLHIEAKFQQDGVVAIHPGCFEGKTNLLRQIGLNPSIGGAIVKVFVDSAGFMKGIEYTFVPYDEIENDWENWPVPDHGYYMGKPQPVSEPVYRLKGRTE